MLLPASQYHTRQVVLSGSLVRGESQEAVELEEEYKQRDHIYLTQELRVFSKKRVQVIGEVVRRLDSTLTAMYLQVAWATSRVATCRIRANTAN